MGLEVTVKFCASGVAFFKVRLHPRGRVFTQSSTVVKLRTSSNAVIDMDKI